MKAFPKPFSRLVFALAVAGLPGISAAQFTYSGCDTLKTTDFQRTELFSRSGSSGAVTVADLSEPVAMAFNAVKSGDSITGADIYFVQRKGSFRKYDATAKTVKQLGFINNAENVEGGSGDNGLMGVALDPNFNSNRYVYLWYCPPRVGTNNYRARLSRFTLGVNDTLQANTEKILIDIMLSKTRQWHAGGPMRFDAYGDLWITIGNNANDLDANTTSGSQYSTTDSIKSQEWGASNTASMRGGVIRIHPDNSTKGYSIPAGNFGEYWANYFENNGNATLAAQYRDTTKVLPEIYVKGTRSNFSIAVHPTKRWLAWGEVNYSTTNDEFNLITTPAFTGFPYFHKNNVATPGGVSPAKVAATPLNISPMNSGVTQLPPATPAVMWYGSSVTATTLPTNVAIGGDIYVYNRNLKSGVKFPPHFNHVWLAMRSEGGGSSVYGVLVDSVAVAPTGMPQRLDNGVLAVTTSPANIRRPVQASYGPDGALYFLNYGGADYSATANSGVLRVAYTGSCVLAPVSIHAARPLSEARVSLNGSRLKVLESGRHEITLLSSDGREVFRAAGEAGATYELGAVIGARRGVYVLRVKTSEGLFARSVPLL
jgi:cytochrome c